MLLICFPHGYCGMVLYSVADVRFTILIEVKHTHARAHTHAHAHAHTHTHTHARMHALSHTHTHSHTLSHTHIQVHHRTHLVRCCCLHSVTRVLRWRVPACQPSVWTWHHRDLSRTLGSGDGQSGSVRSRSPSTAQREREDPWMSWTNKPFTILKTQMHI